MYALDSSVKKNIQFNFENKITCIDGLASTVLLALPLPPVFEF